MERRKKWRDVHIRLQFDANFAVKTQAVAIAHAEIFAAGNNLLQPSDKMHRRTHLPFDPRSKRDDLKHNALHRLVAMCRADLESNRAPRVYFNWKRPHTLQVFGSCSRTMITVKPRDVTAAYPFAL